MYVCVCVTAYIALHLLNIQRERERKRGCVIYRYLLLSSRHIWKQNRNRKREVKLIGWLRERERERYVSTVRVDHVRTTYYIVRRCRSFSLDSTSASVQSSFAFHLFVFVSSYLSSYWIQFAVWHTQIIHCNSPDLAKWLIMNHLIDFR